MKLIKDANSIFESADPSTPVDIMKHFHKTLKGKEITGFGKNSKGLWGRSDEPVTFKITGTIARFIDSDPVKEYYGVGNIDISLLGYKESKTGMLYTDPVFLKNFKALLKTTGLMKYVKDVGYSEQGMQPKDKVNMDISLKVK